MHATMTGAEAIRIAETAAREHCFSWNPAAVVARRVRKLWLFPVWEVFSAVPQTNRVLRVTIPEGSRRPTQFKVSSRIAMPPGLTTRSSE